MNAQDIQLWLRQEIAATGLDVSALKDFQVDVCSSRDPGREVMAFGYADDEYNSISGFGATVGEAMRDMLSKVKTGAELAAEKRAKAARLLAEAEEIERPKAKEVLP